MNERITISIPSVVAHKPVRAFSLGMRSALKMFEEVSIALKVKTTNESLTEWCVGGRIFHDRRADRARPAL
jgi:hypothetical protein